jgi:hypothetical protein
MRSILIIYSFFIFVIIFYADDHIPIPDKNPKYEQKYIITDPESGDKIVSNQIIVIFDETATTVQQKNILRSCGGKIIGGIPDMDAYYIAINNVSLSFTRLKNICNELEKNKYVLYASPRVISVNNSKKINKAVEVERRGEINLEIEKKSADKEEPDGKNSIYDILLANRGELIGCIKRKYNISGDYHGSLLFRISITQSGEIADVYILESDIKDELVRNCLKNKIKKWDNFPGHSNKSNMQIEFRLKF